MSGHNNRSFLVAGAAAAVVILAAVGPAAADQVVADDLIVQGSKCVGVDCVNGETFGAATLRLKENNLRLDFIDTSVAAGAPTADWRLEANESNDGGPNYFAIINGDDLTSGPSNPNNKIVRVEAGGPENSLVVDSKGRVGVGANPSKTADLTVKGGDTPAVRVQQDNSAGKVPQDWDVAVNDDGFYIGQDDGGLAMPFRIGAGASGKALVVSNTGKVGLGTANPKRRFQVEGKIRFEDIPDCAAGLRTNDKGDLFCTISSSRFKNITGALAPEVALANVMALKPKVGAYKKSPDVPEHWLIAEEAAQVDPAFVGLRHGEPFTVKTQNVIADLIVVLQQQRREIEALKQQVAAQ